MIPGSLSDPARWAEQPWSTAALGDARRRRRAVQLGTAIASQPDAGLPQQAGSWREWKSAYRLLNETEVTHQALSGPHGRATRQQAAQAGTVLFVQDTRELDFTAHRQTTDLGWIGHTGGRGFLLHSGLALRPGPVPEILGLAAQQVWTQQEVQKGTETRAERARRPKESEAWAEVVERVGATPLAPDQCWVSVSDRGRNVFSCRQEGQPGHTVRFPVAWSAMRWCPPRPGPERRQAPLSGWCVRCWEAGKRKNALEWVLFPTVPVTDAAAARERLGQKFKPKDCQFLTFNTWRVSASSAC